MLLASEASEVAFVLLRKDFDNLLVERVRALGVTFVHGITRRCAE
jgi:flavin-dependent dehydrogenase